MSEEVTVYRSKVFSSGYGIITQFINWHTYDTAQNIWMKRTTEPVQAILNDLFNRLFHTHIARGELESKRVHPAVAKDLEYTSEKSLPDIVRHGTYDQLLTFQETRSRDEAALRYTLSVAREHRREFVPTLLGWINRFDHR